MSSLPRRMATRRVGSLLLLYQGPDTPADSEWDECLSLLRPIVASGRVLVITHGGAPNAAQRARLSELTKKHPIVAAVMSDNIPVRFVVSCVALFMSRIRSFASRDTEGAYRHLALDAGEREMVQSHLAEMRTQVTGADAPERPTLGKPF